MRWKVREKKRDEAGRKENEEWGARETSNGYVEDDIDSASVSVHPLNEV